MIGQFVKNIAKKAGFILLDKFKKEKSYLKMRATSKEAAIKYDKILDKFIIQEIKKKFKTHNILTEESGFIKGKNLWLWVVDSLDGTGNFANQNPFFCVSIAVFYDNDLIYGSIFAPALNEFYFAQKGKGAFLNNKKIKVSDINDLKNAYVVYCEGNETNKKRLLRIITKTYLKVKDLRKIGSAGIECAWVASGKVDAYFTTKIDPWDVSAGILLIKEAGGKITDFKNKNWQLQRSDLLATNKKIHTKFLKSIF